MRYGRRAVRVTLVPPTSLLPLGEDHAARTPGGGVRRILIVVVRVLAPATLGTSTSRTIRAESLNTKIRSLLGFTTFPFVFPHRRIVQLTQVLLAQHIPGRGGENCPRGGRPPIIHGHVSNTHAPSVAR